VTGPAAADRVRLAEQIAAARKLLDTSWRQEASDTVASWAYWCGQLEARLDLVCEAAERAFGEPEILAELAHATAPAGDGCYPADMSERGPAARWGSS
jgi:hypothetical protein